MSNREKERIETLLKNEPYVVDRLAMPVIVGNRVLYPVRHSSTCWLETGEVSAITNFGLVAKIKSDKTGKINTRSGKNIVKIC